MTTARVPNDVTGDLPDDAERTELARLTSLRLELMDLHPFWGHLLMQFRFRAETGLEEPFASDGYQQVWFDPVRTAGLSRSQLGFSLLHLAAHQLHAAAERRRWREPVVWSQAMDYAINRLIAGLLHPAFHDSLYDVPAGALVDDRFEGMPAESIYELLLQEYSEAGDGRGEADSEDKEPQESELDQEDEKAEGSDSGDGHTGDGSRDTGARPFRPFGSPVSAHAGGIDMHVPRILEQEDLETLRDRIRVAVQVHRASGHVGHVPQGALDRILGRDRGWVPWRRLFRRWVEPTMGKVELDSRRPDRRWLTEDFVVPGLVSEQVERIVVGLDTSGSMTADHLKAALAEIRAMGSGVTEVYVVVADNHVREVVTPAELEGWIRRGIALGGGGTDHRPVFQRIREMRLNPVLFVGLSDLHSYFPETPPPYPVVWLAPVDRGEAPWGKVITVRE